jgi:hypothetical protein
VIAGSKDYTDIGSDYMDLKLKVLSRSLFLEMINWLFHENTGRPGGATGEGLENLPVRLVKKYR